jgi:hypothetical protein
MIVSFAGKARAGKDTCADVLVKKFGFKKMNLADPLKRICSRSFEVPLNYFYDDNLKDKTFDTPLRITSENVHKFIMELSEKGFKVDSEKELSFFNLCVGHDVSSPREMLQFIGTDVCRKIISDDIWLKIFIDECNSTDGNVVCADARFPNEREAIKKKGGLNVLVTRPGLESGDSHSSENLLGDAEDYDVIVINDRSKQIMESDIESWWFVKAKKRP